MSEKKTEVNTRQSHFVEGLALLLIAFKLAHIITWNWAWVLAPVWVLLLAGFVAAMLMDKEKK